jgi:hypothetical protein
MATYTDPTGKDWLIEFDGEALGQVVTLLDLDLTNPADRERLQDPGALLQTAKILCREELAASRLMPRLFRKRIRRNPDDIRFAIEQAADDWRKPVESEPNLTELELIENEPLMEE